MSATTWLGLAQHLHAEGQPYAMVTVMRALAPTSAKAGDKALVTEDGQIHGWVGGGCAQPASAAKVTTPRRSACRRGGGGPGSAPASGSSPSMKRTVDLLCQFQ